MIKEIIVLFKNNNLTKLFYTILFFSFLIFFLFFLSLILFTFHDKLTKIDHYITYNEIKTEKNYLIQELKIKYNLIGYIHNNKIYYLDGYGYKNLTLKLNKSDLIHIYKNVYLYQYLILAIKHKNNYYLFQLENFISLFLNYFLITLIFIIIFIFVIFLMFYSYFKANEQKTIFRIKNENANNAFHALVENLHHELTTPVSVLKLKFDKLNLQLQKIFEKYSKQRICHITNEECGIIDKISKEIQNLFKDKKIIENAFEQIEAIIYNMKEFKHIKLSNGDKNIYELFEGAIKIIITLKNINASYSIDEKLKKYKLNHNYDLTNGDLINVIVNLAKNSLEANANHIKIKLIKEIDNNKIEIAFIDNGDGISKNIAKKIFNPNFSSKKEQNIQRGNGLYISKTIFKRANSDIYLYKTSNKGTEFRLILNVQKIKRSNYA